MFLCLKSVFLFGFSTPSPILNEEPSSKSNFADQCVLMNIETGSYKIDKCERNPDSPAPFICKKVDDETCPTIDSGYKYMKASKKCYKVNNRQTMWQDAMQTCFMEGGTLAVIENKAESDSISSLIQMEQYYFVGFSRLFHNGDLYTVKGKKLDENNPVNWREPDEQSQADCGVIIPYNNELSCTTIDCGNRKPFICQIDIN